MDAMTKMWISFLAIGLMACSALLVTFARTKTRGWIRAILTIVAFFLLILALIYGAVSIL